MLHRQLKADIIAYLRHTHAHTLTMRMIRVSGVSTYVVDGFVMEVNIKHKQQYYI